MDPIHFVGLGRMGTPMAAHALKAGHAVTVFSRDRRKTEVLAAQGATVAGSLDDLFVPGGLVASMVSDDAAVREVFTDERVARLGSGGLHVSMSTISPALVRELVVSHARRGVGLVAAPVFGRPEAAAAKKLWVAMAGPADAKRRAKPFLDAVGQGVVDVGDDPAAASVIKLAGNLVAHAIIEALGEACLLAEANNLPRAAPIDFLTRTLFDLPVFHGYGGRIVAEDYGPGSFTAALALKDMQLVADAARGVADGEAGTAQADRPSPLPVLDLLIDRLRTAVGTGRGEADATVIAQVAKETARMSGGC